MTAEALILALAFIGALTVFAGAINIVCELGLIIMRRMR